MEDQVVQFHTRLPKFNGLASESEGWQRQINLIVCAGNKHVSQMGFDSPQVHQICCYASIVANATA
jgi:hypothetical protein